MKKIRVAELFAGVGGFRLGLEAASNPNVAFEVVWSNQWEPGSKTQHASEIYETRFGKKGHSNEDIQKVITDKFEEIKDHDLLVGGFPCQDYSVARTANQAAGLSGKKGVLWWSIHDILKKKGDKAPSFLMLENVDRLLKSPSSQRGRDFAVMLASLSDLGYIVEWRVINAADYGMPQRRRRIFILGYKKNTSPYKKVLKSTPLEWLQEKGTISRVFPVLKTNSLIKEFTIEGDLAQVSKGFALNQKASPFETSGVMIDRKVYTKKAEPSYSGKQTTIADILVDEKKVPKEFFIKEDDLQRWEYLKGGKNEPRKTRDGHEYSYSEGPMVFPDALNKPSRTIVTGEGGSSPSRFKHVIKTKSGKLRRLLPEELERLNMFPAGHTQYMKENKETPDVRRAFIMGNALVVGIIKKLGESLTVVVSEK